MLPRANRISDQESIEKTKKEGVVYQKKNFGVCLLKREDKGPSRFVFIVSSKITKSAVQRNRITRAMREAIRYSITKMSDGYDAVFLAKKISARKLTEDIMNEVNEFLKEAKLVK